MPLCLNLAKLVMAASIAQSSSVAKYAAMRKPVRLNPCVQWTAMTPFGFDCNFITLTNSILTSNKPLNAWGWAYFIFFRAAQFAWFSPMRTPFYSAHFLWYIWYRRQARMRGRMPSHTTKVASLSFPLPPPSPICYKINWPWDVLSPSHDKFPTLPWRCILAT